MPKNIRPKKSSEKPKKKIGRPETDVEWIGIGVRFTADEKERLRDAAKRFSLSQAEFIRRGTLDLLTRAEKEGRIEITAAKS